MQCVGYAALLCAEFNVVESKYYKMRSCTNTSLNSGLKRQLHGMSHRLSSQLFSPENSSNQAEMQENTCAPKLWECKTIILSQVCDMVILPLWSPGNTSCTGASV